MKREREEERKRELSNKPRHGNQKAYNWSCLLASSSGVAI